MLKLYSTLLTSIRESFRKEFKLNPRQVEAKTSPWRADTKTAVESVKAHLKANPEVSLHQIAVHTKLSNLCCTGSSERFSKCSPTRGGWCLRQPGWPSASGCWSRTTQEDFEDGGSGLTRNWELREVNNMPFFHPSTYCSANRLPSTPAWMLLPHHVPCVA